MAPAQSKGVDAVTADVLEQQAKRRKVATPQEAARPFLDDSQRGDYLDATALEGDDGDADLCLACCVFQVDCICDLIRNRTGHQKDDASSHGSPCTCPATPPDTRLHCGLSTPLGESYASRRDSLEEELDELANTEAPEEKALPPPEPSDFCEVKGEAHPCGANLQKVQEMGCLCVKCKSPCDPFDSSVYSRANEHKNTRWICKK